MHSLLYVPENATDQRQRDTWAAAESILHGQGSGQPSPALEPTGKTCHVVMIDHQAAGSRAESTRPVLQVHKDIPDVRPVIHALKRSVSGFIPLLPLYPSSPEVFSWTRKISVAWNWSIIPVQSPITVGTVPEVGATVGTTGQSRDAVSAGNRTT